MPGGLGDILFGSDPELQVQQHTTLTPEQEAVMAELLGQFWDEGLSQGNFLTDQEQMSLAGLEERALARATDPTSGESRQALFELIQGRGQPTDINDFFTQSIENPALESFGTNVLPAISRSFGGAGFFGSERAETDRRAQEELIDSLTQQRSSIAFQERGAAADRLLRAIGLAPQVEATETDTLLKELEGFGTGRRARDTRIAQIIELLRTQGRENLGAGLPGSTGLVQSFLEGGGGGALAGLISTLSDRRLKENIKKVGVTPSGHNWYSFNYKGSAELSHGVMADEVRHVPGAVVTDKLGYDHVNYSKVI